MKTLSKMLQTGGVLLALLHAGVVTAGDPPQGSRTPRASLSLGFSTWLNRCDVPAGGQATGMRPSIGPFFSLAYGKVRLSGTFYLGNFHVEPEDGIIRTTDLVDVRFRDDVANEKKYTSEGKTSRMDLSLNLGYEFSRYARLSFSLVANRHTANLTTLRFPEVVNGVITLPSEKAVPLNYSDTQYWIGEYFQGSLPVQTVSTRFSVFYNFGLLILADETGAGRVKWSPENSDYETLTPRTFGRNLGFIVSTGVGFQLLNDPLINIFAGYNAKMLAEYEVMFVDHSHFQGPYFGIFYTVQ